MSDEKLDNLRDLLETFMDPSKARQAAEEIREGERILRQNPAPEPSLELVLKIKAKGYRNCANADVPVSGENMQWRLLLQRQCSVSSLLLD